MKYLIDEAEMEQITNKAESKAFKAAEEVVQLILEGSRDFMLEDGRIKASKVDTATYKLLDGTINKDSVWKQLIDRLDGKQ
jgi:hypothetical protein